MQTNFEATIESHNTRAQETFFADWYFVPTDNKNVFKATVTDTQGTRSVADRNFIQYMKERYALVNGTDYTIVA